MKNGMDYEILLDALDKAEKGPILDEKVWDAEIIGKNFRETLKKYDIKLDKDDPYVTADDALADRLWEAGMELAIKTGVFCIDTKRHMKWTKDDLEKILSAMPDQVVLGMGDDTAKVIHRRPEDDSHVMIYGGPFGIPVSEELFIPFHEAYAREPLIEVFNMGTLLSTRGRMIRAGSPWEAIAAWQEKELAFEILDRVGRPGMAMGCVEIATTEVGELAATTYGGYRPTDVHKINFISEQKTAYHHLIEAAHYAHIDAFSESYFNPMYGGYVGGGAGVALACVSGSIVLRAAYQGTLNNIGPTHVHLSASTHPEVLRALQLGLQALSRNGNFLTSPFIRPTSGPGTREIFYETGALAVAATVAGCSYIDASQSARGTHAAHASPLEVLFVAKLTHAVEGMTRKEAAPIVAWLVDKYKDSQSEPLVGKPFDKLHDLETLDPKPEWKAMYVETLEELKQEFKLDLEI
ncbi:MAG: monomethylamine:corrinoid methyltransferase [Chloroflexi bacterium]|nr:monomethylamine:corrinoid methyltransferase [Chloroflexota bacterium]